MDVVLLDAQAGENGLALLLQGLLADRLTASESRRRDFESMGSTFGLVAPDAAVSVTLKFGRGRCTIFDGLRRAPDLVITADSGRIPEVSQLSTRYGVPWLLDEHGQSLGRALWKREIRVEGLLRAPASPLWLWRAGRALVDLYRLVRILSAPAT